MCSIYEFMGNSPYLTLFLAMGAAAALKTCADFIISLVYGHPPPAIVNATLEKDSDE